MWMKWDIIFCTIVLICVVSGTEVKPSTRLVGNSSCPDPIACECLNGDRFTLSTVVNCTDSIRECVDRMKDHCPNQDVCVYYNGDVQKGRPNVTSNYKNLDAFENLPSIFIPCNIKSNPPAAVQWLFNGIDIKDRIKSGFYNNHPKPEIVCTPKETRLILYSVRYEFHHGQYACVAKNSYGEADRKFKVSVNVYRPKPTVQCTAVNAKAYLGSSFNISCSVLFRPGGLTNARYLRNNKRFEDDERHELIQEGSRFLMVIKNVTMEDAGVWELRATQRPTETSKLITLEVVPCPAGFFCAFNESTPRHCEPGTYNDGTYNITYRCEACPAYDHISNYTLLRGAKSIEDCPSEAPKQKKLPIETQPSTLYYVILFIAIGLLFPGGVLVVICFRARNRGKRHLWRDHADGDDVSEIQYDVFISFSEKDHQFAKELQLNIESQGYRCCFHHRDFCPGEAIVKSITDAIYQSLVTLVVLSPDYIESKWCRQELDQALTAAIGCHRVLPVIYKPCKKIPRQVRSCVTYLEYKTNNERQFWKKLFGAIENFCGQSNKRRSYDSADSAV